MVRWSMAVLAAGVGCVPGLAAQERGVQTQRPLETKLMASLDAGHLHVDSPVFAKVMYDWEAAGCRLRAGSTVAGRIVAVQGHRQGQEQPSMTIAFERADCNGATGAPFGMVLFSVIGAADAGSTQAGMVDAGGLFGSISAPLHLQGGGGGGGKGAAAAGPPLPYDATKDMSLSHGGPDERPKEAAPGQVRNLGKVTLGVGSGAEGASVLSTTGRSLRVERESELVLVVRAPASSPSRQERDRESAVAAVAEPPRMVVEPRAPEAPDETEVCAGSCTVVGEDEEAKRRMGAKARLSLAGLGFEPHESREFMAFTFESALTYLDSSHLLFTFDPHDLRRRSGGSLRPDVAHTMRAVLVDPERQRVLRVMDWRVLGEGQHVWPAGAGRVLVRVGHELRIYEGGLKLVASATVAGPVAWVSVAPSGGLIAVGVTEERHTEALHQQLRQVTGVEPEEGINVLVMDGALRPLFRTEQRSVEQQPVLSDTGEVRVMLGPGSRWTISETRPDHSRHTVAEAVSTCEPKINAPIAGYLFVVGCTPPLTNWYRMLRMDGHTVLKGRGSSRGIEQAVSGTEMGRFAVRVVRSKHSMSNGSPFHKDDLSGEEISVFRAKDGRRLMETVAEAVPLSEQSFALSPSGTQIAVLARGEILFYSLAAGEMGAQ